MKMLYGFEQNGDTNMQVREVADDYVLTDADKLNWTDVEYVNPVNGGRPRFDQTSQSWIEIAIAPSAEQEMINALGQQVAGLTAQLAQAQSSTAPASDATATSEAATSTASADGGVA